MKKVIDAVKILAFIAVIFIVFLAGWVTCEEYGQPKRAVALLQLKCYNDHGAIVFNHTGKIRSVIITDDDGNGSIVMTDIADGELLAPQDALCSLAAVTQAP